MDIEAPEVDQLAGGVDLCLNAVLLARIVAALTIARQRVARDRRPSGRRRRDR